LRPLTGSFHGAHAAFELGQVSRARKILIIATLFGAFEPAVNPCEKEANHNNLQEIGRKRCSWPDVTLQFVSRLLSGAALQSNPRQ
jgi:hypothetical protein